MEEVIQSPVNTPQNLDAPVQEEYQGIQKEGIPPPLPPRNTEKMERIEEVKLDVEAEKKKAVERAESMRDNLITHGFTPIVIACPNIHISHKTGHLSGYEIIVPELTPAYLVIDTVDMLASVSTYLIDVGTEPEKRVTFENRVRDILDGLKKAPFFHDQSVKFEPNYEMTMKEIQSKGVSSFVMGELSGLLGVYRLPQNSSFHKYYALVIQSYFPHENLTELIRNKRNTIQDVLLSQYYSEARDMGDLNRNKLANVLIRAFLNKTETLPDSLQETKPIAPKMNFRYNIIEKCIDPELRQSLIFFNHCYSRQDPHSIEHGILYSKGFREGFFWLMNKEEDTPFTLEQTKNGNVQVHLFPMSGVTKMYDTLNVPSQPKNGEMIVWGSPGPNPYSYPGMYPKLTVSHQNYAILSRFGYDTNTRKELALDPVKIYISSYPGISPNTSLTGKHLSLKHWIDYPIKDKTIIWIPLTHPFISNYFMPLYVRHRKELGIYLIDLDLVEYEDKEGIIFNRLNLLKLIRAEKDDKKYIEILNS